jgi:hypothetical protein
MAACCDGSLCALTQVEDQWTKLRSRSDLYVDDMTPAVELLLPMIEEAGDQVHVLFMNDEQRPDFAELLSARAPQVRISDVTVPNQLWNILADL